MEYYQFIQTTCAIKLKKKKRRTDTLESSVSRA